MYQKLFSTTGNKINSTVVDREGIKFLSSKFNTIEEFDQAFKKKISLQTKLLVPYENINSISKEEHEQTVYLNFKTKIGVSRNCEFSFIDQQEEEEFFNYFETEQLYKKEYQSKSPFKSAASYLFGIIFTSFVGIVMYNRGVELEQGTASEIRGKGRIFDLVLNSIGLNGAMIIIGIFLLFFLYKAYTRFTKPPKEIRLTPRKLY